MKSFFLMANTFGGWALFSFHRTVCFAGVHYAEILLCFFKQWFRLQALHSSKPQKGFWPILFLHDPRMTAHAEESKNMVSSQFVVQFEIILIVSVAYPYWTFCHSMIDNQIEHNTRLGRGNNSFQCILYHLLFHLTVCCLNYWHCPYINYEYVCKLVTLW